jgi:PhnB protein
MAQPEPHPSVMSGVIPYLSMDGRAAEALGFYARAFGGAELDRMPDPQNPDRVMHCTSVINGRALMMTDFVSGDRPPGRNFGHLQLVVADGRGWWDRAVAAGCKVIDPFERQFWGDDFGLLEDPFGIKWAILQPGPGRTPGQGA